MTKFPFHTPFCVAVGVAILANPFFCECYALLTEHHPRIAHVAVLDVTRIPKEADDEFAFAMNKAIQLTTTAPPSASIWHADGKGNRAQRLRLGPIVPLR